MAGSDRPIFVLGCPRSGTTLVQVMLHSHPRIAVPPENRFLIPAYRRRVQFGNLEEPANRKALAQFLLRRGKRFRDLGIDRKETAARIVEGPPTLGSAIGIVLQAYAERFDRARWGDKRPHYTHYVDVLMRLFPDAQIVHVIRDPRDCVASLKRMPWWKRSSYYAVSVWADAIDYVARASHRWPGVVVPLRYERLAADPEPELRALCAALGEDYEPAMAEPERVAQVAVPERKHWHSYTHVGPTPDRIGRWREGLEPWEVSLCETMLGARMKKLGYELTGAGRPRAEHLLRYAGVRAERKLRHRAWTLEDVWLRRREPNPVAALLTSGQRASAERQEVVQ